MLEKNINTISFLTTGIFLVVLGIMLLIRKTFALTTLIVIVGLLLLIRGIIDIFMNIILYLIMCF